jgi:hypothetical protein
VAAVPNSLPSTQFSARILGALIGALILFFGGELFRLYVAVVDSQSSEKRSKPKQRSELQRCGLDG